MSLKLLILKKIISSLRILIIDSLSNLKLINLMDLILVLTLIMFPVSPFPGHELLFQGPAATFTNPVFDGQDPWYIRKGEFYYYVFSEKNGISISRSRFITKREETKRIWSAPAQGWNRSCIWAPELHFFDGHWYIYYAAGESGPPYIHQRTGVLMSDTDDPFGSYTDKGVLYTGDNTDMKSDNKWAIDMTVFSYNSRLYAVWSGWEELAETDKTPQHLYLAEMENPYTMKSLRTKISSPDQQWETGGPLDLQEGPEVLMNGDRLFIVYSCRESWTTAYRLGILELKDPSRPPTEKSSWEKTGPVFSGPMGVGHCSFVKSPDEKEDWIIYHSKKSKADGWQRDVRLQPFTWTSDGFPDFGVPVEPGAVIKRPSGEYEIELSGASK